MLVLWALVFGVFAPILSIPGMLLFFLGVGMVHDDSVWGLGLLSFFGGITLFFLSAVVV